MNWQVFRARIEPYHISGVFGLALLGLGVANLTIEPSESSSPTACLILAALLLVASWFRCGWTVPVFFLGLFCSGLVPRMDPSPYDEAISMGLFGLVALTLGFLFDAIEVGR